MPTESIRFPGPHGELAARLDTPVGQPRAYALFAHCFTCSKESKAAAYVSQALAGYGIATLRFDFSGLEFTSNIDDLLAAAGWLRENRAAPQVLAGHSLGGAAVLAAAGRIPEARAVATIGAPFEPAQYAVLIGLLRKLSLREIAAHSDVAPGRKSDPGAHFDWARVLSALSTYNT